LGVRQQAADLLRISHVALIDVLKFLFEIRMAELLFFGIQKVKSVCFKIASDMVSSKDIQIARRNALRSNTNQSVGSLSSMQDVKDEMQRLHAANIWEA
jgi:hypothetical protein